MTTRTPKGVPRQADRDAIIETRSAFFAAERAARQAIETYERAKLAYVSASEKAGVRVYFDDEEETDNA